MSIGIFTARWIVNGVKDNNAYVKINNAGLVYEDDAVADTSSASEVKAT